MKIALKDAVARLVARFVPPQIMRDKRYFELWQGRGYHVTPVHFYEPIPDTSRLGDDAWPLRDEAAGVRLDLDQQLALLASLARDFGAEWATFPRSGAPFGAYQLENGSYESVDAELAYGIVRRFRPRRVFEIGSGWSSLLIAQALAKNGGAYDYRVFDPYPGEAVDLVARVERRPVQQVPLDIFDELGENDLLFVDSSHVVALGSDVQRICLEIVPRLRPGTLVHFHDVFMPREYPREWVARDRWFWTEQYLVQAFLAFNDSFEVLWAGHYVHAHSPEKLRAAVDSYDPALTQPASLWLRRIR